MTEYLVDTAFIRSLSFDEEQELSRRKGIFSLTASYLVPSELLSGTKPNDDPTANSENGFRKAALGKYYRLVGFDNTYWESEDTLIQRAFGIALPSNGTSDLKQLIRDCVNAQHFNEIDDKRLKEFRETDFSIANTFRTAFEEYPADSAFHELRADKKYIRMVLGIFAMKLSIPHDDSTMTCEEAERLDENLRSIYNGSLDLFIDFWFAYINNPGIFRRGFKRMKNDVFDLKHLLYLRVNDANQLFVTDDGDLLILVKKVAPDRILSKSDFFNRVRRSE